MVDLTRRPGWGVSRDVESPAAHCRGILLPHLGLSYRTSILRMADAKSTSGRVNCQSKKLSGRSRILSTLAVDIETPENNRLFANAVAHLILEP
jgi:hypothetical protein